MKKYTFELPKSIDYMNIMMLFMNIEKMIGDDLQTGLESLKAELDK